MDKPWYRQAWPWLVMTPPLAAVIAGFAVLWIAAATNDVLVTDDERQAARPQQAANCAAKDRACLEAPVREGR